MNELSLTCASLRQLLERNAVSLFYRFDPRVILISTSKRGEREATNELTPTLCCCGSYSKEIIATLRSSYVRRRIPSSKRNQENTARHRHLLKVFSCPSFGHDGLGSPPENLGKTIPRGPNPDIHQKTAYVNRLSQVGFPRTPG